MLMLVGIMWVGSTPTGCCGSAAFSEGSILGGLNSKRTSVDFPLPSIVDEGPGTMV